MDWQAWHADYDVPGSRLARRLAAVQERVRVALDAAGPGPIRVVSACAGQGRDLLPVLAGHPRRADVHAKLVELDPQNAVVAREAAAGAGLDGVEVVTGDAALTDHFAGTVPADLVLLCGIFGNITDADIERTVGFAPQLCAAGAMLVWTRHREPPDLVPTVCGWFERQGFETLWVSEPGVGYGIGVQRFTGTPQPLVTGERMFRFLGYRELLSARARRRAAEALDDPGAGQLGQ